MIAKTKRTFIRWWRPISCSLFLGATAVAVLAAISSSRATNPAYWPNESATAATLAPWVTEDTENGEQAEFIVVLADQADLSGSAAMSSKSEKGNYLRDTLWNRR